MSPPKLQTKPVSASDRKRDGSPVPPAFTPQQMPESTPSPPPVPAARPSTPTYTFLAQTPTPQFLSVRTESRPDGSQDPQASQPITGSLYFPTSRIRLIHASGPEISEYDDNARYIILGDTEDEINAISDRIYRQLRGLILQCTSDEEVNRLLASAQEPAALAGFGGYVVSAEAFLNMDAGDKQKLPQAKICKLFEVLVTKTQTGYDVYRHPSRGGIAATNQINTALEKPENMRDIYAIVELAEKIGDVLDRIMDSASYISLLSWNDPTEKNGVRDSCITLFAETIRLHTGTYPDTKPFLDRIQANLSNIFSWHNLRLLTTAGIDMKRIKGLFKNQVLWYSGVISDLSLNVDEIDNPYAAPPAAPPPAVRQNRPGRPSPYAGSQCCELI